MPYCTYCGAELKPTDKFCIYCGKPRITQSSNSAKKERINAPPPQKATASSLKTGTPNESALGEPAEKTAPGKDEVKESESPEFSNDDKKKGKKNGETEATESPGDEETEMSDISEGTTSTATELLPDIKEQVEIQMELALLALKKKKIAQKVVEASKLLEDPQYELDTKFQEDVNAKIAAIKEVKTELEQQKSELKGRIDDNSPLTMTPAHINVLKSQIEELKINYKFHKVERDVFDQLNSEYTEELTKDMKTYTDMLAALKTWQVQIKAERHKQEREANLAKARFRSREITQQELHDQVSDINRQIEKLDVKLKVLGKYLQKR